ncbi:MAG: DUF3227 domain-containing protein [Thaumarchaeota archaeon]|nr:DUF3227 domain-containing protein [Nitrososphaerota archaeon]
MMATRDTAGSSGLSLEFADAMGSLLKGIQTADYRQTTESGGNGNIKVSKGEGAASKRVSPGAIAAAAKLAEERREVVIQSVDNALDVIGRTGREVFFEILEKRYGVTKDEIAESPGKLTSTLKLMLDSSAAVIEGYAVREIKERMGVEASSLEEAVELLKSRERSMLEEDATEVPYTMGEAQGHSEEGNHSQSGGNPIEDFLELNPYPSKPKARFVYHYRICG